MYSVEHITSCARMKMKGFVVYWAASDGSFIINFVS